MTDSPYRQRATESLASPEVFALVVHKCQCVHYTKVHVFEKSFLTFRHLQELYPTQTLFLDARRQLALPWEQWQDRLVCATLTALRIQPCSTVNDLLCYRWYASNTIEEGGCTHVLA